MEQEAYLEQESVANRQAIEVFVHASDLKLALEVQKLGSHALDDVMATTHRVEGLQKDYFSPNTGILMSEI